MIVEYDIDAGKLWTTFPTFTLTVCEEGEAVKVEDETGKEIARYDVDGSRDNAHRLLRGLAILCDLQALTTAPRAA